MRVNVEYAPGEIRKLVENGDGSHMWRNADHLQGMRKTDDSRRPPAASLFDRHREHIRQCAAAAHWCARWKIYSLLRCCTAKAVATAG